MDVGVAVFFVISGFLLFRPFVARQLAGQAAAPRAHLPAAARRCACIPGYWFALTVCVVLLGQLLGGVKDAFLYYFAAVPVREPGRGAGRRARARGRLRDPAGVEPHRRVRLLPDAAGARALAHPHRRGQGAVAADPPRPARLPRRSTSSARCSASTSSPPTRRGSASPRSGRRTGSTSSPSGWRWPRSASWEHARRRPAALLQFLGDHPVVSWCTAAGVGVLCSHVPGADHPGSVRRRVLVRWFLFGVFAFFLLAPAMFGDQTKGRTRTVLAEPPAGATSARSRSASTSSTSR